jgi:hypothetical protein
MHYVKSHQMQKHKFGVMHPSVLFVESDSVLPEHEKSVLTFHARKQQNALRDPLVSLVAKRPVPVPPENEK